MGLQNIKMKTFKAIYKYLTLYFQKKDMFFLRSITDEIMNQELRDNFTTKPWNKINKIKIH